MTNANKNEVLNDFVINVTLIDPITKIVSKLEKREFRDCDIKWLDTKLFNFAKLAGETLGINLPPQPPTEASTVLNEFVTSKYISYFTALLKYFKSF